MGQAELSVFWFLIVGIGVTTTRTCWGVWRLHMDVRALRQHVAGYRDDFDEAPTLQESRLQASSLQESRLQASRS